MICTAAYLGNSQSAAEPAISGGPWATTPAEQMLYRPSSRVIPTPFSPVIRPSPVSSLFRPSRPSEESARLHRLDRQPSARFYL